MRPPRPCSRSLRALPLAFPLLLACACATPPPVAPPPPLRVDSDAFAGTVLTGPSAEPATEEQALDALGVSWRIALLPRAPAGEPLPVRLVVVDGLPEPFRTRSELASGARTLARFEEDPAAWQEQLDAALLPGSTSVLVLEPEDTLPDAPRPPWERLEIEVSRRADDPTRLEVALALSGLVAQAIEVEGTPLEEDPGTPATLLVQAVERVVLTAVPPPGAPAWRLAFPAPTSAMPQAVVLVELSIASVADAELAAAVRERVDLSRRAAAERATGLSGAEGFRIESASALEALSRRELGRPALLYLAGETGAELVAELALIADVEDLGDLLAEARERLAGLHDQQLDPQALGWLLESTAWLWLAERAGEGEGDRTVELAPELEGLLLRAAGEAGRWPDLLAEAVTESDGVEPLRERLARENRIFLEDAVPATRVRAHDWLEARGLAPEGYDPLASAEERRAALARLEQAEEAAAEEGSR